MNNNFSIFESGFCFILLVTSAVLLFKNEGYCIEAGSGQSASSREYNKLFSTLLNPNDVDFEGFGADSKQISVIGMFSDKKQSGSGLDVMHWINYKAPEESEDYYDDDED